MIAIIPARMDSTRLPGKMLADVGGQALVVRTWARVVAAGVCDAVVVATDSVLILNACKAAGIPSVETGQCENGTVRVAEAARRLGLAPDMPILNVQGDEPLVAAATLLAIAKHASPRNIVTGAAPLPENEANNAARVKVVVVGQRALYFSRAAIPHGGPYRVHVGVYGYSMATLQRICALPAHDLERQERLEQLRWLAHGEQIEVVAVPPAPPSVDTAEDLDLVRQIVARNAARG